MTLQITSYEIKLSLDADHADHACSMFGRHDACMWRHHRLHNIPRMSRSSKPTMSAKCQRGLICSSRQFNKRIEAQPLPLHPRRSINTI